jgi:hypothetical protein
MGDFVESLAKATKDLNRLEKKKFRQLLNENLPEFIENTAAQAKGAREYRKTGQKKRERSPEA